MKKLINITLIGLLLAVSACTDLELTPTSSVTPDAFFSDENSYRAFLAKIYAGLAVTGQQGPSGQGDISSLDEGFSSYLRVYWKLQELTTEEAVISWGDAGIRELHAHTWSAANQFVNATYYRIFFQISLANEFLRESTDEKLDARKVRSAIRPDIARFRAEARFLRALSYYHGIESFGNIPFYTEENEIGSAPPQQVSRTEVFNFIESELKTIEGDLAAPGTNEYGRADQAALWMLQAKLYLNAGVLTGTDRYSDCIMACNKVINSGVYDLQETYAHLFGADNNLSPEIIFAIPFDGENTQTFGGTTFLVNAAIGGAMDASEFGSGGGWSGLRTTSAFVDLFPDEVGTDSRGNFFTEGQSKEINDIPTFTDGYAVRKFTNVTSDGVPGQDATHADTDFPMFRLADAYLMYAEAVLRGGSGGDRATALGYINELRERAYGNSNGNITDADLDLDFILDERARELYWEASRRIDLIRFDLFTENGVWPWKGNVKEGRPTERFRDLFPFPEAELVANPNLTQNTGY